MGRACLKKPLGSYLCGTLQECIGELGLVLEALGIDPLAQVPPTGMPQPREDQSCAQRQIRRAGLDLWFQVIGVDVPLAQTGDALLIPGGAQIGDRSQQVRRRPARRF